MVYNDESFIERCVSSVLAQTYPNVKIKILDNGSTDRTPDILKKYTADSRVEIRTNPVNQRSEFAAREGLNVDTQYLTYLFSDDVYDPNRIERLVAALEADPTAAAVFCNNRFVDEHQNPLERLPPTVFGKDVSLMDAEEHLRHFLYSGNSLHPCSMLLRTDAYRAAGGWPPYLHRIGDMTFFARLLRDHKVIFTGETLQSITLLSSNRNESFQNSINLGGVALERACFLDVYRGNAMLAKIEKVLPDFKEKLSAEINLAERLFWLGSTLFEIPTADHRFFGIKCMYDSYTVDPSAVDAICYREFSTSFPQYAYALQAKQISRLTILKFRIRKWISVVPGGNLLIRLLKSIVKKLN